ncbi:unannotated protein [freshwater metagenome]|uniref:Unannotated protein n=1 Tax=freshwater metagenome TaxID=449393 RepID=A0A6J7E541_9ZZZZ
MGMERLVASTRSFSAQKIGTRRHESAVKVAKGGVSLLALVALGLSLGTPSAQASESTGETRSKVVKLAQSFDQFHTKYRAYGWRGASGYPVCNRFTQSVHRGSCQPWCADFVDYVWSTSGVPHPSYGSVAPWAVWSKSPARHLWHPVILGTFTAPNFHPQPGDLMVYGSSHIAIYVGGSGRSTISTHGNFPDGVYTYPNMVTNTGKPSGTYLTGYIQMPSVPVHPTTSTTVTTVPAVTTTTVS